MQAYELNAHIDEHGNLQLPSSYEPLYGKDAKLILLIDETTPAESAPTLAQFAGALKGSPSFSEDPVIIQRAMRDEWQ